MPFSALMSSEKRGTSTGRVQTAGLLSVLAAQEWCEKIGTVSPKQARVRKSIRKGEWYI